MCLILIFNMLKMSMQSCNTFKLLHSGCRLSQIRKGHNINFMYVLFYRKPSRFVHSKHVSENHKLGSRHSGAHSPALHCFTSVFNHQLEMLRGCDRGRLQSQPHAVKPAEDDVQCFKQKCFKRQALVAREDIA